MPSTAAAWPRMLPAVTTHQTHPSRPRRSRPLARIVAGLGVGALLATASTIPAWADPTTPAATESAGPSATASPSAEPSTDVTTPPAPSVVAVPDDAAPLVGTSADNVVANKYIVVLKDKSSSTKWVNDAVARSRKLGATVHDKYSNALQGYSATLSQTELAKVRQDPAVDYVQADQKYTSATSGTEDDATWGIDRIDQRNLPLKKKYYYTDTGAGVTAYVVDTGIRSSHFDFTTNSDGEIIPSRVGGGTSTVANDDSTEDCAGHGTHVAGTIGGVLFGVAKDVHLVPIRVLNCDGESDSATVAKGLDWIVANHTKSQPAVANMSLSSEGTGPDTAVEAAVSRVIKDNVTVVVAAGNGDKNGNGVSACSFSPSDMKTAIVVGATTKGDKRTTWSNYGSCVDLYAPGQGIESDWYTADNAAAVLDGTSMATPHVTGAVALYLEKHPTATPATVQKAIVAAATPNKVTNVSKTWPRRLLFALQPVAAPKATSTAGQITSGTALLSGKKVCSPNKLYCLLQRASDGKLVLQKAGSRTIWSASKGGAAWTKLNTTGNLASYDKYNRPVWSTATSGTGPSTLFVRNTGNLELVNNDSGATTWTSKSTQKTAPTQTKSSVSTLASGLALYRSGAKLVSPNGTFSLALRSSGDLVLTKKLSSTSSKTIWHTKAKDDDWLVVRTNGDLELVRSDGKVVWKTATTGDGVATLILKNTGNLALTRTSDKKILWSTKTSGA
jgi:subtilisin family serine protease